MLTDNTAEARAKMLIWLNTGMQDIARIRPWMFLQKTATVTLTNSAADWPVDCAEPISWTIDGQCIYPSARMSDADLAAEEYGSTYRVATTQTGFTIYPDATSCVLKYRQTVPVYADDSAETVWPAEMMEVLWRLCVARFYEYDFDERTPGAGKLYERAISQAKKWDNRQKPLPTRNKRNMQWGNV